MKNPLRAAAFCLVSVPLFAETATRIDHETSTDFSKNLAREHLGAVTPGAGGVSATHGDQDVNGSVRSLVLCDPSVGYPLAAGRATAVVDLKRIQIVDRVSFGNRGVAGKVVVRAATTGDDLENGQYAGQSYTVFNADDAVVSVDLGGLDARYLSVETEITTPGRIYDFGAYGPKAASAYALNYGSRGSAGGSGEAQKLGISLVAPFAGSDVRYVSSGAVADVSALVDEDATTLHGFSRGDKSAVVVVDTGRTLPITRASSLVVAKAPGAFDVYILGQLPETGAWNDSMSLDLSFLDGVAPANSVSYQAGVTPVAVDTNVVGRYIVYRWRSEKGGLSVADVAAFSPEVTLANYSVGEPDPDKGGIDKDGWDKGGKDDADTPDRENNGAFPVIGYADNWDGRSQNGIGPNFVPLVLAVSWGGRENVPEYVIRAVSRYFDATDNYDGNRRAIKHHLTDIVRYGRPQY